MGNGQVTPNGSVHWLLTQDDQNGSPHDFTPDVVKVQSAAPAAAGVVQSGSSVPGNAAASRRALDVRDRFFLYGIDSRPLDQVGVGGGHPNSFRVRLRFPSEAEARAAITQANDTLREHNELGESGDMWEITLDVPVVKTRTPDQASQTPNNPYAQIRFDW
jgi:hypothetical protein